MNEGVSVSGLPPVNGRGDDHAPAHDSQGKPGADFLSDGGEMGAIIRAFDWDSSVLGPPARWPQSLKTSVRLLLTTQHPMFIWWGPQLIQFYNDAYRQSIGPERHPSAIGQPGRECWAEIWPIIGPQIEQVMGGRGATWHENALVPITRYGRREDVYWTYGYSPIDDPQSASGVGGVLVICTETTASVLEARKLASERDRVWRNSRDLLVVVGADGVFRGINPAWTAILGHDPAEVIGHNFTEFIWPDDLQLTTRALQQAATESNLTNFENRYRHKDGSPRWISWHTSVEGDLVYAYGRDVTQQKRQAEALALAQEALRQSQKLDSMGQLTGGVAHDFNNLLTPIIGSLDMLNRRGVGGERERRLIEGALLSAERAKTLVQRLLAFARRQPLQFKAIDIPELVEGMAEIITRTSGPRIQVDVRMAPALPPAKADANQIEMALLNLSVNARDAMPEGGTLTISATVEDADPGGGLPPGRYIRLAVADTGVGMDEATLARAIEPFFSTKGIGKGTGLGLSMVHGLALQLGGDLKLDSRPGQGTTAALWLPISEEEEETPEAAAAHVHHAAIGTALLVDDDELVRMTTADMLAEMGYEVIEAPSATHALEILETGRQVDLLITDHLMPGMSGAELARIFRQRRPGTPVLLVSGYAEVEGVDADLPRLVKPFRHADLVTFVGQLTPQAKNQT
jgi:PAS domain S-box-containing protein